MKDIRGEGRIQYINEFEKKIRNWSNLKEYIEN